MGQLLKQATAVNITVVLVDSTDHVTGKTGLTLTIYASKAAAAPAAITPTVTELDATHAPGVYKLALTTGHTDTLGELELHVTAAGADPTDVTHQVALDLPGADTAGTTTLLARLTATRAGLLDNLDAAVSGVAAAVWAAATRTLSAFGFTVATTDAASIAAIKAKTDNLPASPAAVSDIPTAIQNSAAVVDQALAGHTTVGTVGAALAAASAAGDPWATPLPGAYGAGTAGEIVGNLPDANANADALLDRAAGVETNRTLRQALRLMLASLAGKLSGAGGTQIKIRDTNDTKDRITATVDNKGNRSAVGYDAS